MNSGDAIVYVVDDDFRIREALSSLISSAGVDVIVFESASEFLRFEKPDRPACIVLDLDLPDINGLELQTELACREAPPIVFITAHGDVPSSVRAMKAGAIDFLPKPFREDELFKAINAGIAMDRTARQTMSEVAELRRRYSMLTPREREVLPFVIGGFANKETAAELAASEVTIAVHRGQVMRKLQARSLAELVRMADKLGIRARSKNPV